MKVLLIILCLAILIIGGLIIKLRRNYRKARRVADQPYIDSIEREANYHES